MSKKENITKAKLRPNRVNFMRWFWKGLWILPFSLGVTVTMFIAAALTTGMTSALTQRFQWALGLTFGVTVVLLAVSIAGSGWAQEQADRRVKG